jgi:TatD DNase family protein
MKLFDSHNHIQDERLWPDVEAILQRSVEAGVVAMGVKGCHEGDWARVMQLCAENIRQNNYGQNDFSAGEKENYSASNPSVKIYPSFGLHPWFINDRSSGWLEKLEALLVQYPDAAVGEIGIDHAIEDRDDAGQEMVFLEQLGLARKLDRAVSIHCRRAWGRLIELLDQFGELPRGMLIHCFGGSAEVALELVKRGAFISFSGSITRPNAKKAGPAIRAVPDDRILIETDAPDILPATAEGPLNEPANVRLVLEKAAALRGIPEDELAELTFRNAKSFFDL